jgi:hypothetical protein
MRNYNLSLRTDDAWPADVPKVYRHAHGVCPPHLDSGIFSDLIRDRTARNDVNEVRTG